MASNEASAGQSDRAAQAVGAAQPPREKASLAVQRGRIGALHLHATHDSYETTRAGREAFMNSLERQVDPLGELPPDERRRRGEMARREHFARMAYASSKARRVKARRTSEQP